MAGAGRRTFGGEVPGTFPAALNSGGVVGVVYGVKAPRHRADRRLGTDVEIKLRGDLTHWLISAQLATSQLAT